MAEVSERPIPTGEGLTFEKVWAMFQETDRKMREMSLEADRRMEETDRQMEKTSRQIEETNRQMKETDKKIGALGKRFGELAEHLVSPNIKSKFNELGFYFNRISLDSEYTDPVTRQPLAEIDILLENGDVVIAVEVKSKPDSEDVNEHVERMEKLCQLSRQKGDARRYQGAMAGAIMSDTLRAYILKNGLYAIEQSGDTVQISVPEGNAVREW